MAGEEFVSVDGDRATMFAYENGNTVIYRNGIKIGYLITTTNIKARNPIQAIKKPNRGPLPKQKWAQ